MPNLSIIIPTYNRSQALNTTLSELAKQSYKDFEIVIVDDHSEDDTWELIKKWQSDLPLLYYINEWRYQRDGKKTGLKYAKGNFCCFLDDDIELRDCDYLKKIAKKLDKKTVVYQSKIIMEDLWEKEYHQPDYLWEVLSRYLPVIDIFGGYKRNYGIKDVDIFPLIECGSWFHTSLKEFFVDEKLILDGYGESIVASLRLLENHIAIKLSYDTLIYHIGNPEGWSKRFNKKNMLQWFTEFHKGYIYNMIYIHCRWRKRLFPLWIPYFILKSFIALCCNGDWKWWKKYYLTGFYQSLSDNFFNH